MLDETHEPSRQSWIASARGHPEFPIQNLPLGIFSGHHQGPRAGVAIGDFILDLSALCAQGLLKEFDRAALQAASLNALLAWKPEARRALRQRLSLLLSDPRHKAGIEPLLVDRAEARLHLPAVIGDYTDFYAGIHHALNVGRLFRPDHPLLPNYKYVPVGYHGRASSVRPSGTPVPRPTGQRKGEGAVPEFASSARLDFELELGIWIGPGNALGAPIPIGEAGRHIAGFCLVNDWSARDLQAWEYQPLGPFLAKNFLTTISPWIVTAEALEPFRIPQPARPKADPRPLDHLWDEQDQAKGATAIELEVRLQTAAMRAKAIAPQRISLTEARHLYWTPSQLVAHHSSNGCNLRPGDLLGSGTISGPEPGGLGSLLEISQGGAAPLVLESGERRSFLEDGDEVLFRAQARREGYVSIGFGPCCGRVEAARI